MHYRNASVAALALILSACSTPQHTNLLIFGTNTVVGLKVGADATQTPAIQLAYSRQELVLMPLLANTGASRENGNFLMSPCPAEKPSTSQVSSGSASRSTSTSTITTTTASAPSELSTNCKFLGADGVKQDSYSVLASFGAKGNASTVRGEAKAGGAIAQYFATGLAARELAKHGSALVAASESATADAAASNPEGAEWITGRNAKFQLIADHLAASSVADGVTLDQAMQKLDGSALSTPTFTSLCSSAAGTTKSQCVDLIRKHDTSLIQGLTDTQLDAAVKFSF